MLLREYAIEWRFVIPPLLTTVSALPWETRTPEILFSDSGKLGIRRDHPHHWIKIKFCVAGGLQDVVLMFEFHQNRMSDFRAVGSKFALSH